MGDLTTPGESYETLRAAEPMYINELHVRPCLDSYAHPDDQKHPYVSAVYGDFTKGYPPTLIQGGTHELVLSSIVRLYQAMDQAGVNVKLDVYEGMPHVFQSSYHFPESQAALDKVAKFLNRHLIAAIQ